LTVRLCRLMCGKPLTLYVFSVYCFFTALPSDVRLGLPNRDTFNLTFEAMPLVRRRSRNRFLEKNVSESQRLSAHQAAKPQSRTHTEHDDKPQCEVDEYGHA
jgi:hypothetical protein